MPDPFAAFAAFDGSLRIDLVERSMERVVTRMAAGEGNTNVNGTFEAGSFAWLADGTATLLAAAGQEIGEDGSGFPLAVSLNVILLANQRGGEVQAIAEPVRRGRRVTVVRTRIVGEGDRLLAEVTSTHLPA